MGQTVPCKSSTSFFVRLIGSTPAMNMPLSAMNAPKMEVNSFIIIGPYNREDISSITGLDINDFFVKFE